MRLAAIALSLAAGLSVSACSVPPAREYAYPTWNFAVSFRGAPKVTDTPASASGPHALVVESRAAGRDFLVEAIDGSASPRREDQALADAPANLAAAVHGVPGPMTYAATGKFTGREFTLTRPGHPTAKVRVFVENRRLYELIAESSLGPDEPEVATFLDSFRLLDQPRG
jgi:hypothetical protein